jgi:hypothetical protein
MKATKTKATGRPKKATAAAESGTRKKSVTNSQSTGSKVQVKKSAVKKTAVKKNSPSEDQIRQKAYEIYNQRIARGEYGSEMDDWSKAMDQLNN